SYNLKYDYSTPTPLTNAPTGSNQLTTLDVSVHYYPLGNSRWRPFFKYGLGLTGMSFTDFNGAKKTVSTMSMPVGIGVKYWWNEKIAVHADLIDNIVFGADGVKSQNNWGLTFGMTYALGNNRNLRPTNFWPYTPSGSR
ncbi:MAG: hypothetical protein LBU65_01630, partial [Planctomycetaceae bacterium]|nr:hypothetical protein [Planctomycetaceae bacterium]